MGCTQSTSNINHHQKSSGEKRVVHKPNPLTESEILMRIEAPNESKTLSLDGVNFNYAWVSQRGYYPEALDKDNQDSYSIIPEFGTQKDQAFFAIFDGHGKFGHKCSQFARDNLPKNILEKLDKLPSGSISNKSIRQAISAAHHVTNEAMHKTKKFDDSLSGTTSISILFRGKYMYISNVGDSRAIIVSSVQNTTPSKEEVTRLVAKPLSSDQTPYRKDERERVKRHGARVLSMDQIEGLEPVHENWGDLNLGEDIDEGGDPPRVWSPNGDYPGTAFTRSLGDFFAEECGVIAEPEILEREITQDDRYVIIASDGVFEFLTNQMVADIVSRYTDPLEACKAVVSASYNIWLQYEVRTDDISIIVLSIAEVMKGRLFKSTSSFYLDKEEEEEKKTSSEKQKSDKIVSITTSKLDILETRPVRRVMSREKRKHMIELSTDTSSDEDNTEVGDISAFTDTKSEEDLKLIGFAIKSNFLFQHLNSAQREAVIGIMQEVNVKAGDWIIRQGDKGDRFYIVADGKYEVRVNPSITSINLDKQINQLPDTPRKVEIPSDLENFSGLAENEKENIAGKLVHVYESGPDLHPGFGELSLMYGKPRAASVIAQTDGKLWSLDRKVFRRVVLRPNDFRKNIIKTLKKIELLKCLDLNQMQRLVDLMNEQTYAKDEYIIRQGDLGDKFFLIVKGTCDCIIDDPEAGQSKLVLQLKENDYFGERALLESDKPRAANVVATSNVNVLYIEKAAFEEVLGPLASIIDEDRARRETISYLKLSGPKTMADIKFEALITYDSLGPIHLGSFGDYSKSLCVRSILISEVSKNSLSDSAIRFIETSKSLYFGNKVVTPLLPQQISIVRDPNAVHIVYNSPVISDLSSLIRSNCDKISDYPKCIAFMASSLVLALEILHENHIIYRNVQPESIFIDSKGRIVLIDFRFTKMGLSRSGKTYTICGAADYLAPEQIYQVGHGYAVDLWALGVLLYELSVGSHPFSSLSEVATYSKISSFGSKSFPTLKFPENFNPDTKALINNLLMPTPEARIGAGLNGFMNLKLHPYFKPYSDSWDHILNGNAPSPLSSMCADEEANITNEGVDPKVIQSFSEELKNSDAVDLSWLESIDFD